MANCFTSGHHLPRTTTEWDMAMAWYLLHNETKINPAPPPPPPPTVEHEWMITLQKMRHINFTCTYPAMDDGPSYKAVTDPPFTDTTEKRQQFGNKFKHPLYEPPYQHSRKGQPATAVIPRLFASPHKPLPGTDADRVALYERYQTARRRWEQQPAPHQPALTPPTNNYTVFH